MTFKKQDLILENKTIISSSHVGLIAAAGHAEIRAYCKPTVAILSTGNEITEAGKADYKASETVNSNGPMIAALLQQAGATITAQVTVRDDKAALIDAIRSHKGADILITIGGASVGTHDLVGKAFAEEGMDLSFWKVAMRPGKPLISGRLGSTHILGLPGNPVSAFVCAHVFAVPLVKRLTGHEITFPDYTRTRLCEPLAQNGPRTHFIRAVQTPDGVKPAGSQDSSLLSILSRADGLIVRAPDAAAASEGDIVDFLPF